MYSVERPWQSSLGRLSIEISKDDYQIPDFRLLRERKVFFFIPLMHSSNYIRSKSLNFIISCLMYHWPNIYQIKYFNHCKQWCWRFSNRALLWFTLQGGQELGNKVQGHCPPHHPPPSSHRTALPPLPTRNEEGNYALNMVEVSQQRGDTTWRKKSRN